MGLKNKIKQNRFLKNILMLTGGTAFAQALGIILSPIITRLYTPEDYGVLSIYVSILTLLAVGATLNYYRAIPLAKDEKDGLSAVFLSFSILIVFSFLLTLIFVFKGKDILTLTNNTGLISFMYLIPIGLLLKGIYDILSHWAMRSKDFKTITKTKITQSLASNFTKVGLGLFSIGPIGLILGQILGQSSGIARLSRPFFKVKSKFKHSLNINNITKEAKKNIQFPMYTTLSGYIYTGGNQLPFIMLSIMFGSSVVGLFGLANSIVNLPISLIAMSVSQVYYSEIASLGIANARKIKSLSLKLTSKLAMIGLAPLFVFVFFGPFLFSTVFGANWYEAGEYARYLAIIAYTHFVILPIGRVLEVFYLEKIALIVHTFRLVIMISVFYISHINNFSSLKTIIIYSIVNAISYIVLFFVAQIVLSRQIKINES